jgi:hypothetical protein
MDEQIRHHQFALDTLADQMEALKRIAHRRDTYDDFLRLARQYEFVKRQMEIAETMHRAPRSPVEITYG